MVEKQAFRKLVKNAQPKLQHPILKICFTFTVQAPGEVIIVVKVLRSYVIALLQIPGENTAQVTCVL